MRFLRPALLVFDLDGTLVDTFGDIARAANYGLEQIGRPAVSVETIIPFVGRGGRNLIIQCVNDPTASETEIDAAFAAWKTYYADHLIDLSRPYPGAEDALGALRRRGIRLAVLSNKWHELTRGILTGLGLSPLLDAVQGQAPDKPMKPDPTLLFDMMRQFDAVPETTWMVGDGDADIVLAQNAGILSIGVSWGVHPAAGLKALGADVIIESLNELPDLFD
ncbi:MAG: HAD hydrolase-like protein [Candidatus Hydrogenedentes bacterium]|nr:HAD hydrolase-like protein [Candidatus Hydrogenedentota bacterium]